MIAVVDASVVIAYLDANDAHHATAVDLIGTAVGAGDRLVMHPLNMAEVLVRPSAAGLDRQVLGTLMHAGIAVDDRPDDPVELARLRAVTGLKMPDCCAVHAARRHGARLLTFDHRMAAAAR